MSPNSGVVRSHVPAKTSHLHETKPSEPRPTTVPPGYGTSFVSRYSESVAAAGNIETVPAIPRVWGVNERLSTRTSGCTLPNVHGIVEMKRAELLR